MGHSVDKGALAIINTSLDRARERPRSNAQEVAGRGRHACSLCTEHRLLLAM